MKKNCSIITIVCFILVVFLLVSCKDPNGNGGQPPEAPGNVTVVPGYNELTIKYDSVSGVKNYNIYMHTSSDITTGNFIEKRFVGQNEYTWTGLINGVTYYFIATSENDDGESSASDVASGTPSETGLIPDAPTNLYAMPGVEKVTLFFNSVSGAVSYNIYMNIYAGVSKTDYLEKRNTANTMFPWMGLSGGIYYFVVSAVNSYGESDVSNEASAFVLDLTIKIIASDPENGDEFGYSVFISCDYAIAGAPNEDGSGTGRGSAYIYHRTAANTWDSGVKIVAIDPEDADLFGWSVSISGDYAIAGAWSEDGTGTNRGAAYIFHRTGINTWDSGVKIVATDPGDDDQFGNSVFISGDYAIVGAPYEDGAGSYRGAAYIFHRTGTNTWDSGVKIIATDPEDNDHFGNSVSIAGDYAIVGAQAEDGAGDNRGAAYIFHRTGTNTWDSVIKITAADPEDYDVFGKSVSISGDYAIIGALNVDGTGFNQGAAYIFHRTGTNTWDSGEKIVATDPEDNDLFGCSVSISGNYAIVGAYFEDGEGIDRGAAYIFRRIGINTWVFAFKIIATNPEDNDQFGYSVSISGSNAIVGARYEDGAGTNRGAAYIYD